MIASVAAFNPVEVERVAGMSYAFVLWTFLQREEAERLASLGREREAMNLAAMVATGFHEPKKLSRFEQDWRVRAIGRHDSPESVEEMSRRADEQWAQHQEAMSKRPVS